MNKNNFNKTIINITNLNKEFHFTKFFSKEENTKKVLNNISLQINRGDIFGLVGLNGIGKTTLIKIILDLLKEDNGEVKLFDINNHNPLSRKNICYLPEKFMPSPQLTGYEFLKLSLSFYNKKLDKELAKKYANNLDLNPNVLDLAIKKYSKGMAQKLGLLWCLMSGADLLILDEPMSGLDPKARVILKEELKKYVNSDKNKAIFFSTHILDDVEEICNTMAVLNNGKIIFNGKPSELKKEYNDINMEKSFLKCININIDNNIAG